MLHGGSVLALDLATVFGWSAGVPGEKPTYSHDRFAPEGAGSEYVLHGAMVWFRLNFPGHARIVYEAPVPPFMMRGHTTRHVTAIAYGLAGVCEAVAVECGVKVLQADVADVRQFLIGARNMPSAKAKAAVTFRLEAMGFAPKQHDEADALALWLYFCSLVDPSTALAPMQGRR
jgi:hypothetical protein